MKIVIAKCDSCGGIVAEWKWKPNDVMDNADLCMGCRYGGL